MGRHPRGHQPHNYGFFFPAGPSASADLQFPGLNIEQTYSDSTHPFVNSQLPTEPSPSFTPSRLHEPSTPLRYLTGELQGQRFFSDIPHLDGHHTFSSASRLMQSGSSTIPRMTIPSPYRTRIPVNDGSAGERDIGIQNMYPEVASGGIINTHDIGHLPSNLPAYYSQAFDPSQRQDNAAANYRWINEGGHGSSYPGPNLDDLRSDFIADLPFIKSAGNKIKKKVVGSVKVVQATNARRLNHESTLFRCEVCEASFTRKHNLKNHINSHLENKGYVSRCEKSFVTTSGMKRHQDKCPKCQSVLTSN